tara:strand:- start:19062 stop:19241 length:180 start_codon:yes stop_codon:yes gene_type:complete
MRTEEEISDKAEDLWDKAFQQTGMDQESIINYDIFANQAIILQWVLEKTGEKSLYKFDG